MSSKPSLFERFSTPMFILGCLALFAYLGIFKHFFDHPQGIHFIRQTDTLSFVYHYLLNGMDFFEPGVLSKNSINGNVACEFPLIYYLIALLSRTGIEPYILMRTINLVLTFLALGSVFHACRIALNNMFAALIITFLLFSSSVWVYYANGFNPDAIALSLTLIGLGSFYHIQKFEETKTWVIVVSVASFTLAALLKLTFAVYPIAILMAWAWSRLDKKSNSFGLKKGYRIGLLVGLVVASVWFLIMVPYYNAVYKDSYFLTSVAPIWELSKDDIRIVWDHVSEWWFDSYYYPRVMELIGLCLVLFGVLYTRLDRGYRKFTLLSILGCISYFILFYRQFRDHDYYALVMVPLVLILFIELSRYLFSVLKSKNVLLIATQLGLAVLMVLSIMHGAKKFNARYGDPNDLYAGIGFKVNGIDNYLDELSISRNADILVIGDLSPNGGLYFAQRMGWSVPGLDARSMDRASELISQGVGIILLANPELQLPDSLTGDSWLEIGEYNTVKVLGLR